MASADNEDSFQDELSEDQVLFYQKVADYVRRHPEFVDELQNRIEEEEKRMGGNREKKEYKQCREEKGKEEKRRKNFMSLDDEKINTIADELSGMIFSRDGSNCSLLEKTVQDAFSGMVKNYLSKYAE